jgi:hypothetical protein
MALVAALGAGAALAARPLPRVQKVRAALSADAAIGARGRIEVEHRRATRRAPESEALVLRMQRLEREATYTLWCIDPFGAYGIPERIAPWEVTATRKGVSVVRLDTAKGGALPYGATLSQLAGCRIQVRDAGGVVVLVGTVPALPAR